MDPIKQRINKNIYFMIASYLQKTENDIKPKSSEKIVKILLTVGGANPNKQTTVGYTPLMFAARESSPKRGDSSERTVKMLLAGGANTDNLDHLKWSALIYAIRYSSPENGTSSLKTVKMILEAGANPNIQTICGYTALMYADAPNIKQLIQKFMK